MKYRKKLVEIEAVQIRGYYDKNERCVIEDFLKNLPAEQRYKPIGIYCSCPKCSPRC